MRALVDIATLSLALIQRHAIVQTREECREEDKGQTQQLPRRRFFDSLYLRMNLEKSSGLVIQAPIIFREQDPQRAMESVRLMMVDNKQNTRARVEFHLI